MKRLVYCTKAIDVLTHLQKVHHKYKVMPKIEIIRECFLFKLMKGNLLIFHLPSIYHLFLLVPFSFIDNNVCLSITQMLVNFTILIFMVTKHYFPTSRSPFGWNLDDWKLSESKCEYNNEINYLLNWKTSICSAHFLK